MSLCIYIFNYYLPSGVAKQFHHVIDIPLGPKRIPIHVNRNNILLLIEVLGGGNGENERMKREKSGMSDIDGD